jgi:hypothetical protein
MNYQSPSFMVLAAPRNATPRLAIETTHLLIRVRSTVIHEHKQTIRPQIRIFGQVSVEKGTRYLSP